jgi:hypothetical protein
MANPTDGIRSINVVLEYTDPGGVIQSIDINKQGLVDLTFNRFLGSLKNAKSGVLTNVDMTMFDSTGYKLLTMFQASGGRLRFRYGFEDDLSETYTVTIVKFKSTHNNMGAMSSIGSIAKESYASFGPEIYRADTLVETILIRMAKRNNWYIGDEPTNTSNGRLYYRDHINVGDLKLPWPLYLEPGESDTDFIYNKLLPLCQRTVVSASDVEQDFWDVTLFSDPNLRTEFYFRKFGDRELHRRVWSYEYGMSIDSGVLSLTNTIDYTFLINGLSIKHGADPAEYMAATDAQLAEDYTKIIVDNWTEKIKPMFEAIHLPAPDADQFALKLTIVPMEEATDESLEVRLFNELRQAIMAINTVELQVIGNWKIKPIDIIDLQVRDREGHYNIVSGLWKVVKISENIGKGGYVTNLSLVRETSTITFE